MHEGTPIAFSLSRPRRRRSNSLNHGTYFGIIHALFNRRNKNTGGQEQCVHVWCPATDQLHSCEIGRVSDLHGKQFDMDSILIHDWLALAATVPRTLVIQSDWRVTHVTNMEKRAKASRLIHMTPTVWPKNTSTTIESWEPQACWLNMENASQVWFDGVVLHFNYYSIELHKQDTDDAPTNDKSWIFYDPAEPDQTWQPITRERMTKAVEKYLEFCKRHKEKLHAAYEERKANKANKGGY